MRIASIDIGTNTLRLLVCEYKKPGHLEKLRIEHKITRLGEGFSPNEGLLKTNAKERTLSALRHFSKIIDEYEVKRLKAVATSAVRESRNGFEFIEQINDETDICVDIISGEEESRLTVKGVLNTIEISAPLCLIIDIGGGSTEYVEVENAAISKIKSLNLGAVHLTERFLAKEWETSELLERLSKKIGEVLRDELSAFEAKGDELCIVATAGTTTTLASIDLGLSQYDSGLVNNYVLTKSKVARIIETLLGTPKDERTKILGLEEGREDIIIAGGYILLNTLERFYKEELIVSDGGLLEGIAYSLAL